MKNPFLFLSKNTVWVKLMLVIFSTAPPVFCSAQNSGKTEITKWQFGKKTAVSLTYDDGNRNQFKYALPIMEKLHFPGTFFIITGPVKGSEYPPKFVGRPVGEIISESKNIPTNADNFFERASASLYLGYAGTLSFYNKADEYYESGKKAEAFRIMDSLYLKVRNKDLPVGKDTSMEISQEKGLSWDAVKAYADKGFEFASHTVSHAHLAILDTANMGYELRKSKEDILKHLGKKFTFSAEVPFDIEDKRVMKYSFDIYPALRNSMPEPFMDEINRGYKEQPGNSGKEYVQWQRGPLTKTPFSLMKSWIDTSLAHENIWLVLVFHGIDDVGWQPLTHQELEAYFQYIKSKEKDIWVAAFGNVARYVRERMNATVTVKQQKDKFLISLSHSLDPEMYDEPLTLKTYVPDYWKTVLIKQEKLNKKMPVLKDENGFFVLYQVVPNAGLISISELK